MKIDFRTLQFSEKVLLDCANMVRGNLRFVLAIRRNATLVAAALKEAREMVDADPLLKAYSEALKMLGQEFSQKMQKELASIKESKGDSDQEAMDKQSQDVIQRIENEHRMAVEKLNEGHKEALERNKEILDMELDFTPFKIDYKNVPDLPDDLLAQVPVSGVLGALDIVDYPEEGEA